MSLNDVLENINFAKDVLQASKKLYRKDIRPGITLTDNKIKDILKLITSLEKRRILLKGITRKLLVKKEDISFFFFTINDSWLTIYEKCTHTIS